MNQSAPWRQAILERAAALGRPTYQDALGIGIEFEDGCDVFWVLPGEVTSTFPVPAGTSPDPHEVLTEYDSINRLRERALHVILHYLASRNVHVDRRRSGRWPIEWNQGWSSTLEVGERLTRIARDTRDVYRVVQACFKNAAIRKPPSPRRMDRYRLRGSWLSSWRRRGARIFSPRRSRPSAGRSPTIPSSSPKTPKWGWRYTGAG